MSGQQPDLRNPILLLAFGFGSGLARRAPGTWGSLAAVPLFLLLGQLSVVPFLALMAVLTLLGIHICGRAADLMGVHDHSGIVFDEFLGQWLTFLPLVPIAGWNQRFFVALLVGFGLFRLFDIAKPWPIRWFDAHVEGGLGIMLDDLLAAIPAGLLLWLWVLYSPALGL